MFVKSFPVLSQGFEIETEMTIHALDKNFVLASIPVDYRDRPSGSVSKLSTFSDGFKVLRTIARLVRDYRPLPFFSLIAALFLLIAVILFIPVWNEFRITGLVPRFPTLFAAGFMALAAIQMFCCGLILHTNGNKNRQAFEVQLNMLTMLCKHTPDCSEDDIPSPAQHSSES